MVVTLARLNIAQGTRLSRFHHLVFTYCYGYMPCLNCNYSVLSPITMVLVYVIISMIVLFNRCSVWLLGLIGFENLNELENIL